jgi:hypothetical protein
MKTGGVELSKQAVKDRLRNPAAWRALMARRRHFGTAVVSRVQEILEAKGPTSANLTEIDRRIAAEAVRRKILWNRQRVESQGMDVLEQMSQDIAAVIGYPAIEIEPEVVADLEWAIAELARTGFADMKGDYVAILNLKVVGSGDSEAELREQLAERHSVSPGRFVVEYKGPWY